MIRKAIAAICMLMGLALMVIEGPGLWRDYQIDQSALVEATDARAPDGGCSKALIVFTVCGFSLTDPEDQKVRHFDYIHLQIGQAQDTDVKPMQYADKTVLTLDYGMAQLQNRFFAVLAALMLAIAGLVLWGLDRRRA